MRRRNDSGEWRPVVGLGFFYYKVGPMLMLPFDCGTPMEIVVCGEVTNDNFFAPHCFIAIYAFTIALALRTIVFVGSQYNGSPISLLDYKKIYVTNGTSDLKKNGLRDEPLSARLVK